MKFPLVLVLLLTLAGSAWGQSASSVPPQNASPEAAQIKADQPAVADADTHQPAPVTLTNEQIKELIRKSADNDIQNDLKQRDYTYIQRSEAHFLDGNGEVKKNESETVEIMVLYGDQVERKIAKNDKPLSGKDAEKEEKKIQELIDKRKNESDDQRQKRLAKQAKDREEARQFVQEIADAYNFTYRGTQELDGRNAYLIDCEPRPGFKPHRKEAKYLTKFRGRVWIDPAEFQLVKMDAEAIDTVSWGLFLARIQKGAHLVVEQTRVNDEVWLPKHVQITFNGRLALVKTIHMDVDVSFKDYKKFRSSSRIVSIGGPPTAEPATTPEPR